MKRTPIITVTGDKYSDVTTISIKGVGSADVADEYVYGYYFNNFTESEKEKIFKDDVVLNLQDMEINPQYRRQGYAKKLMKKVISYAKKNGYKQIYLNASPMGFGGLSVRGLVSFYKKFGFKSIKDQGHNVQMIKTIR